MHINYATHVVLPVCGCLNVQCLLVIWLWEYGLEIFGGLMFGHGNFGVSLEATVIFLGEFCSLSIIPVTLTLG